MDGVECCNYKRGIDREKISMRFFFFQAEDGIRALVRSRGLGDVYKRQAEGLAERDDIDDHVSTSPSLIGWQVTEPPGDCGPCLLYTSDAADERSSVDLGGRRIIKKKQRHGQRSTNRAKIQQAHEQLNESKLLHRDKKKKYIRAE